MTDYGTIKIPREQYEQHNKKRKEMRVSWVEYLNGEAPELSENTDIDESEIARMVTNDLMAELPRKVAEEVRR